MSKQEKENELLLKSLTEIIEETEYLERGKDRGILTDSGSGIGISEDGSVNISSSDYSQYKLSSTGVSSEISLQSNTITNTKNLRVDNIAINRHRINPGLWELTDFKKIDGSNAKVVGNLNMTGTVLVKAWEPTLQKYVLIRRPMRMPIFSTTLNVPDVPEAMSVESGLGKDLMEYLMKKEESK